MLPKFLKIYRDDAKELLKKGAVKDCEFSRGTYQVFVITPRQKEGVWTFLQINQQGKLVDSFCECDEQDDNQGCVHLATAYLHALSGDDLPLHIRFERSFWNFLCFIFSGIVGDDPSVLKNHYSYETPEAKFRVKGTTDAGKTWLKNVIESSGDATETTSIKFSHLSQEELALWREGTPSKELTYELSFWSDLAKKMFLHEADPYNISFQGSEDEIPTHLHIRFPDFELDFSFPKQYWPLLIPTLGTVKSPLKVYGLEEEGEMELYYDSKRGAMEIRLKDQPNEEIKREGIPVDGWLFVPGEGFFPRSKTGLFSESLLMGPRIGELLTRHTATVRSLLINEKVSDQVVTLSYSLVFDPEWNLSISAYAFRPGDLSDSDAHIFGEWLYLPGRGFMRYKGKEYHDIEMVIKRDDINNFVSNSRSWLNSQQGFETHQASLEAQLTYFVDAAGNLHFSSRVALDDHVESQFDFGQWIYIADEGFYQKSTGQLGLPVRPGTVIKPNEIPLFIRMNRDELTILPNFFSPTCPIEKSGLSVRLDDEEQIVLRMIHVRRPQYEKSGLRFFDDYVYTPHEGFHKLPIDPRIPDHYHMDQVLEDDRKTPFLSYELDLITPYLIDLDPRLIKPRKLKLIAQKIEEREGGLDMKLTYASELGEVDVQELLSASLKKERFVPSDAGLIDLRKERFGWIFGIDTKTLRKRQKAIRLSTLDLLRLFAYDHVESPPGKGVKAEAVRQKLKELTEFTPPSEPNLEGFRATLRPYQGAGLKWLWFLYNQRLSGLLCDDMGLGKTLQSMALMDAVMNSFPKGRHYLIVCPTSVIYHWQDKLKAFLPKCRVFTFYGSQRSLAGFREEYDVLLTSYGIWRRETEILSQIPFEVAILDEIQVAKNPRSKLHGSLMNLQAKMKIGLTGTPIENYLRELKALFDIVLPGYLPGPTDFRDYFVLPIEKQQNKKRLKLLTNIIHPFILRRKKEDVLLDLPDKIEEIADCPLLPQQQALYQETLNQTRASILRELDTEGQPVPFLHVFALLSRLKQICNHPAVYYQNAEDYEKYQSGKWERFTEIIDELQEGQQKAVVFSQYLTQLDIIEMYLEKNQIGYAGIRGATVRRADELKRFHEDPNCRVFVASLQAAGLGIDLTPATVVIHYDRWWNAARENQATDRVHRIGQTRGVQVFKFVTRGTFEEKIHQMIERKGRLMEEVIGVDDQTLVKSLSREDIFELLQDVHLGKDDQIDVIQD